MTPSFPLMRQLPPNVTPEFAWRRMEPLGGVVFFDSAASDARGRYSFVAADPFLRLRNASASTVDLDRLRMLLTRFASDSHPDLPPFQGGAAGLLGYELASAIEPVALSRYNDLPTPALAIGLYDVVAAFDRHASSGWLLSHGFPETAATARHARAAERLEKFFALLTDPNSALTPKAAPQASEPAIAVSRLAPQYDTSVAGITSNFSADKYRQLVDAGVELIRSGELFQVNLAQRLLCRAADSSVNLYLRLRQTNPAPYAGYLDLGDIQVCSASPECFLTLREGWVETRPIKGTSGRSLRPEADLYAGDALFESDKDRAENVMIVDLMRNDLSRVCEPRSVHVTQLCGVETYAFVKHLVSAIRGKLRKGSHAVDLLRACFPGGSITGAPKIRAMQAIASLEPTTRGPYCGSLAYFGFDGQMDANLLIRTITAGHGWWQLPVGGGIVAQSLAETEYRETWHKARGLLAALDSSQTL